MEWKSFTFFSGFLRVICIFGDRKLKKCIVTNSLCVDIGVVANYLTSDLVVVVAMGLKTKIRDSHYSKDQSIPQVLHVSQGPQSKSG